MQGLFRLSHNRWQPWLSLDVDPEDDHTIPIVTFDRHSSSCRDILLTNHPAQVSFDLMARERDHRSIQSRRRPQLAMGVLLSFVMLEQTPRWQLSAQRLLIIGLACHGQQLGRIRIAAQSHDCITNGAIYLARVVFRSSSSERLP